MNRTENHTLNPTLSDADRDRLTAAAEGTGRPLTLVERARWTHLERHHPRQDRDVIRAALTAPPTTAEHRPSTRGTRGRAEAAKRYGTR